MVYDEALLSKLERGPIVEFSGNVWRVAWASQDPLRPNVRGARWNPPDISALYTSESEAACLAEFAYLLESQPVPPRGASAIHRLAVQVSSVLDASEPDLLKEWGLDLETLPEGLAGHEQCRVIGGAAAFLDFEAMWVPSMRLAGARNFVIFTDELLTTSTYELVESTAIDPPLPHDGI